MRSILSATQSGFRRLLTGLALLLMTPLAALASSADIALRDTSAVVSQTPWSLEKTGRLSGNTVNWTITATPGTPHPGALVISGQMTVVNRGSAPATIGNIVVNLQVRSGNGWITLVSNVADATSGDAATTALVMRQASSEGSDQFMESGASGELEFMDAANNTVFSLVPQILIPAGGSRALLFQASFDNSILAIPAGAQIRSETIVSFGNATAKGNSVANLDINGNGAVDADEANVRSVPARIGLTVPVIQQGNDTVSLSDTLADIVTTGTVTFTNATFNLGATGGTVSVTYNAGADGGTITNCANLTGTGVDLEACDTQTIPDPTTGCTPGAPGCGWNDGDLRTYAQFDWGGDSATNSGAALLEGSYGAVYGALFEIGIPGTAGFSMIFTSSPSLFLYLPSSGPAGILTSDLLNPTSSPAGAFAGHLAALKLNVDFSDARLTPRAGVAFGDVRICNVTTPIGVNNMTVRQLLSAASTLLGGGSSTFTAATLAPFIESLNESFLGGVSTFAQNHLVNGPCPGSGGWNDGDLLTYRQVNWTTDPTAVAMLESSFSSVYAPSGVVEIGIPGTAGFSLRFSSVTSIRNYLPQLTGIGPLNADLVNPTSSSSGIFGGEVLALRLNIDFSDAGVTMGSTGIAFGDLTLCALGATPSLDGLTVRAFSTIVNTALGGGTTANSIAVLNPIISELNSSFGSGGVGLFAQNHLVNGPCPGSGGWEIGEMLTYTQGDWGDPTSSADTLLQGGYLSVYADSFGVLRVGIPGSAGFSMSFSDSSNVRAYLPAIGLNGALTSNLSNPTSTSSGSFGGEVVALKLNIDFDDANLFGGFGTTAFGDLRICGLPTTGLSGLTVRDVLALANLLLGGGSSSVSIPQIASVTALLNGAFFSGAPGAFAQNHLVDGSCPP